MVRHRVSRRRDRHDFRRTAVQSRKINISPKAMRGGIRL